MKTGTAKNKEVSVLLKVFTVFTLLFVLTNFFGIVYSHTPPYSEGTCLKTPNPNMTIRIDKNLVVEGISEVTVNEDGRNRPGIVSFMILRNPQVVPMDCR